MVRHYGSTAFGKEFYQHKEHAKYAFSVSNRYTGQIYDEDTGLYYYGSRYYDPELARFIQPDTIVPEAGNSQALNRYSYVTNNPLKYVDPTGHELITAIITGALIGGAIGATVAALTGGNVLHGLIGGAISGGVMGGAGHLLGGFDIVGYTAAAAGGAALSAVATGGDPGQAAMWGAIGTGITAGIGAAFKIDVFPSTSSGLGDLTFKEIVTTCGVHSASGGIAAEIQGGNFWRGAADAAIAAAASFVASAAIEEHLELLAEREYAMHVGTELAYHSEPGVMSDSIICSEEWWKYKNIEVITNIDLDKAILEWHLRNVEGKHYGISDLHSRGGGDTMRFYIDIDGRADKPYLYIPHGAFGSRLAHVVFSEEVNYIAVASGMRKLGWTWPETRGTINFWNAIHLSPGGVAKFWELGFGKYAFYNYNRVVKESGMK